MAKVKDQEYQLVPIDELEWHPANPRHGDIPMIQQSIEENDFYGSVEVQVSTKRVVSGNHRWQAAKAAGITEIPVIWLDIDDEEAMRILLIDNRASDVATNDERQLADILLELQTTELGLAGTGYTEEDLEALVNKLDMQVPQEDEKDIDAIPAAPAKPRTKPGDLWELGPHRLLCGDCRVPDDIAKVLAGATINVAFTSPPYAEQRQYDDESGFKPIPPEQYVEWFQPVAENVKRHLAKDGSWFVNIKPAAEGLDTSLYVMDLVLAHARQWGWHFATEFVWERNGIPKSVTKRFKNQFEPIYQFALDVWKMRPENVRIPSDNMIIPLGDGAGDTNWEKIQGTGAAAVKPEQNRKGQALYGSPENWQGKKTRKRKGRAGTSESLQGSGDYDIGSGATEGWAYPGNRLPTFSGSHEALGHSAAFPVGLPGWFLKAYSDEGDVVFDPFMGSGSTIMAAHVEGRVGIGCELSPAYCDIVCKRFQDHTGIVPKRKGKEVSFA